MAQYQITHACTHTSVIDLTGRIVSRLERVAQLEQLPCPRCRAARNGSTVDAAGVMLPALSGSDKQIAWALTIRDRLLREADALMVDHVGDAQRAEIWQTIRAYLVDQRRAAWWIDRRDHSGMMLVQQARREVYAVAAPVTPSPAMRSISTEDLEDSLYGDR